MAQRPARVALLEAINRGRDVPQSVQVHSPPRGSPNTPQELQGLEVEDLQLCSERDGATADIAGTSTSQAWMPIRLVKQQQQQQQQQGPQPRLPVAVLLHSTGQDMGSLAAQQAAFARRGYLAVTFDCRYHGGRAATGAASRDGYQQALVRAWRGSGEHPFLLDNVWDLQRLLDYLQLRPDVDPARIGMTGVSLGGMHTWLTAAADERVAAAAPMIGVQWFGWAVQEKRYQARVESIPLVFQAAAADMAQQAQQGQQQGDGGSDGSGSSGGSASVTPEVVTAVLRRLLPGLLESYDAPQSLPLLAPRPLLIANGELDPRCPMEGVELALGPTRTAYAQQGAADSLELYVAPGVGHETTEGMWQRVHVFMDRHLLGSCGGDGGAAVV